ncbi:type I methionyl aminopeptidase [Candidatus Woesebacteria bacterium RIFCSPHIGHO2_01_FULL_44_21]|uniref:Methionine aminopeptidase n=1 Tax=Candidatus Woesebacteria bacterium RIFCSPHIGHO2_01_FULL_44_21 TaxID=1802503 RepID=A0A1F7Z1J5_9BACT|nr:MAG: type I methionyl aminopeptidase [Candidatus Woesebacteria bacterium RIFCSPHIGHO2_01_FULL_44_21]OGM71468.1 MAG: type I methionyl aminopeptidase [Candidatus Woesebacteria bacterium RIFCSPLOWO2_01_FULL_44_24b]
MQKFELKTKVEIAVMAEGGKKLARVKGELQKAVKEGENAESIEKLAVSLIKKEGAKPSFAMVPGYRWATCVNVNDGLVHGIPVNSLVFKDGDIVSVDVGLYYKGFHTDTSFTVLVGKSPELAHFLEVGRQSLGKAIRAAKVGHRLGDISRAIESNLKENGYSPVTALVGHGIGRELHEDPMVPCYSGYPGENFLLNEGAVLAIEVMYAAGSGEVKTGSDGWTIRTKDGKMSALFEETVALTRGGPIVLTK